MPSENKSFVGEPMVIQVDDLTLELIPRLLANLYSLIFSSHDTPLIGIKPFQDPTFPFLYEIG